MLFKNMRLSYTDIILYWNYVKIQELFDEYVTNLLYWSKDSQFTQFIVFDTLCANVFR